MFHISRRSSVDTHYLLIFFRTFRLQRLSDRPSDNRLAVPIPRTLLSKEEHAAKRTCSFSMYYTSAAIQCDPRKEREVREEGAQLVESKLPLPLFLFFCFPSFIHACTNLPEPPYRQLNLNAISSSNHARRTETTMSARSRESHFGHTRADGTLAQASSSSLQPSHEPTLPPCLLPPIQCTRRGSGRTNKRLAAVRNTEVDPSPRYRRRRRSSRATLPFFPYPLPPPVFPLSPSSGAR